MISPNVTTRISRGGRQLAHAAAHERHEWWACRALAYCLGWLVSRYSRSAGPAFQASGFRLQARGLGKGRRVSGDALAVQSTASIARTVHAHASSTDPRPPGHQLRQRLSFRDVSRAATVAADETRVSAAEVRRHPAEPARSPLSRQS